MASANGADHFEEVKVGLPYRKKGELAWNEVPLQYQRQEILGYCQRDLVDSHEATVTDVNARKLERNGYYVRLEYGGGNSVVWGQPSGENHAPTVRK